MIFQILTFLGGLALLMFGLKNMTESLQKLAGDSLSKFLGTMGKNRITGLLSGAGITAAIQSSTATTLLTVTFVNAGLFTLNQAIPIIMGANIGTTITAWIMSLGFSFDMGKIVYPIFVIGIVCIYMKRSKARTLGEFVFGLAFLFFGLTILKSNAESMDLGHNQTVIDFFKTTNGHWYSGLLFLLVGGILTFCVQSSAAIVAFTQLLCASGVLQIDQGIALVLGENIGTTLTSNISAMKASTSARRAALAHLMFNLFGVIWVFALFTPFTHFVSFIWGFGSFENLQTDQLPKYIAAFHTSFNVCNVLLLIGFIKYMEIVICKIIKKTDDDEAEGKLKYIGGAVVQIGDTGMTAAEQETLEMGRRMQKMFGFVEQLIKEPSNKTKEYEALYNRILKYETISDNMEIEISKYLAKIGKNHLSNDAKEKTRVILKVISELESIGDSGANLARSIQRRYDSKAECTDYQKDNIKEMFGIINKAMAQMNDIIDNYATIQENDTEKSFKIENEINSLRAKMREENIENITQKKYEYISGMFYMEIINGCEKIGDFIINIVQEYKRLRFKK